MGSQKKFGGPHQYPFLVNLNLEQFMIGKPMNCDEFAIKNEISAKSQSHMMQNPKSSASSSSSSSSPPIIYGNPNTSLAKNAIGDAWNGIVSQKCMIKNTPPPPEFRLEEHLKRNEEDFLQNSVALMAKIDQEFRDWQHQEMLQAIVGSNFHASDNRMKMSVSTTQVAEKSSDSKFEIERKYNFRDEQKAKSIERRQKRMIKNRESAARSRARKQAYINQLQHKVCQLQITNKWLRKRKEVINRVNSCSKPESKSQLRRSSSIEF